MENASKALIIAGAILISIVLITFGVIILNQGSQVINNTSLSETEVSTFNAKFTGFEGSMVRGSKVNSLLNTVVQNNMTQDDVGKKVEVTGDIKLVKNATSISGVKADTGKTYVVTCNYNPTTGLISSISVNEAGKTNTQTQ